MIIDLSVTLNEQTPVYPGDPTVTVRAATDIAKDGYEIHTISFGTHAGTHIDAPAHMIAGGKTLNAFTVDTFVGRGRIIDCSDGDWADEKLNDADIQPGDIVLLYTGMGARYYEPDYFTDYLVMPKSYADFFVAKQVKMIGLDTCSIDNESTFPNHKILLGADILAIENLTNLEALLGKQFVVYALPLRVELDGGPARVIAQLT